MARTRSRYPRTVQSYTLLPKRISSPLEPRPDRGLFLVGKRLGGHDLHRLPIGGLVGELAEGVADLPDEDDTVLADEVGEEPAGDWRAPGLGRHLIDDGGFLLLGKDRTHQQGAELPRAGEGLRQQTERRRGRTDPGRILQVEQSLRVSSCNRRLGHCP